MPNALARETSPYLQQHAENPVDWHPWGEEVLAKARATDTPILLSVGYSACHWCHVMAHESFEDAETAALMNRLFVNIKVDREERPDLDQIYQTAHQMLTQRTGGWPLTMFLAPDGTPFFSGTYFPKAARYGLPGFADILERVAAIWRERRVEVDAQGEQVRLAFSRIEARGSARAAAHASDFDAQPIAAAMANLRENFDADSGGVGPGAQSSRIRPTSSFACAGTRTTATAMRLRWPTSRSRKWRSAASTTSSAAASAATAPTRRGPSRTSRRCCTTTAR